MPLLWSGGFVFWFESQGFVRVADSTLRPTDKDPSVGTPGLFSFGHSGANASISEGIKACFPPCAKDAAVRMGVQVRAG